MKETNNMRIFVDADGCPVVRQTEEVAIKYDVPVTLLCDTNHILNSDYSEVKVIGAAADAVDFALVNLCHEGDVVVTQDYGVAAMALGKKAYAIHQNGWLCPICGKEYEDYPALSRKDDMTEKCSECGTKEALEAVREIYTVYSQKGDITFIMEDKENTTSVVGFYFGEPNDEDTREFRGKLTAEYE